MSMRRWIRRESQYLVAKRRGERSLLRGADLSGRWLQGVRLMGADLTGADLRDAHLSGADLSRARLENAVLAGAELRLTKLAGAALMGADLSRADMLRASLSGAALTRATLARADLRRAELQNVRLAGADLSGALLLSTVLTGADLAGAVLHGARYDGGVRWPTGVDPEARGALRVPAPIVLVVTVDDSPSYLPVLRDVLLAEGFAAVEVRDHFPELVGADIRLEGVDLPAPWSLGMLVLDDSLGVPATLDFFARVRTDQLFICIFLADESEEVCLSFMKIGWDMCTPKPIRAHDVYSFTRHCQVVRNAVERAAAEP